MKLIQKIEVNYLRSLYSAIVNDAGDMNIIFGRNDSGKSNLLRALSLFFNNQIEPGRPLEFEIDMSDTRKQEARLAKGRQFIWIKITFKLPPNYASIGEEITIKRQWNRDGEMNQTVFPPLEGGAKQARLTRFLNEIDFTYIPAIKDLTVYADLIERMYGTAASSDAIREATIQFVDAIEAQTTDLSKQLAELFSSPARLAPPTEMSRLFRNLDFAHGEDGHSLLRQKGDGVKARHLPEILRFINGTEQKKKFYIWGFEEPENSLDLGAAEAEAHRFASFSERHDTQIFITSHSPAFYLASSPNESLVKRFFITKQKNNSNDEMDPPNAASLIDDISEAEAKMAQAGLLQLPFIIKQLADQRKLITEKQEEAEKLQNEINRLNQPTLFVEGIYDVSMFKNALSKIDQAQHISVKPMGGTPRTTEALLNAILYNGGLNASAPTFFLFDNDKSGRGAYRKLCGSTPSENPVTHHTNLLVWTIPFTDEFRKFMRKYEISDDQAFFTSEFLYSPISDAAAHCLNLINQYRGKRTNETTSSINGDYWNSLKQKNILRLISAEEGTLDWFYARGVPENLKGKFSATISNADVGTRYIDEIAYKIYNYLQNQAH